MCCVRFTMSPAYRKEGVCPTFDTERFAQAGVMRDPNRAA
jgi:hypothetical protein